MTKFTYLFTAIATVVLTACSDYNRVLKSTDPHYKFEAAKEYFNDAPYTLRKIEYDDYFTDELYLAHEGKLDYGICISPDDDYDAFICFKVEWEIQDLRYLFGYEDEAWEEFLSLAHTPQGKWICVDRGQP